eukprot:GHRR01008237.1.p1 GENE.GHRR01008237.1~~GHRR01008237.1.p1  ORF type:complete len:158 (+),score=36.21 GHRR01008237.1:233-706(+)
MHAFSQRQAASKPMRVNVSRCVPFTAHTMPTRRSWPCKAASTTQLALHVGETTIQMPFTTVQGKVLDTALAKLLQTFSEKQEAKRPKRWDMMEVRFTGAEAGAGVEVLEVFCNPNAHATAFDAKLLVTIKAVGGLKLVCEGRLSSIKADLDAFLQGC